MTEERYLEPYRQSAARHGADFRVTLWASQRSQRLRFEVFAQMCDFSGLRLLDAGCSRGDFAAFLLEKRVPFEHYAGIDALPEVVQFASQRKLPRCEFLAGDFLRHPELLATGGPDVVCISGALNTMDDRSVADVLESAWRAARRSLIFNFLSDRCGIAAPPQDTFARRLSTMRLLDWALTRTWSVAYRQDYFQQGHDATILMNKMT